MRPDRVAPISLIVEEAVRNALKYAHPSGVSGTISIDCRGLAGGAIEIEIVDDGIGLPETFEPAIEGGFGLSLMRGLSARLDAALSFTSTELGLTVRLHIPPPAAALPRPSPPADTPASELNFHELLKALPVAVYTTDAQGRISFFNEAAVALWGRQPELGELWCGSWRLHWPDGRPMAHGDCPMGVAIREKRSIRGGEAVAERPDGARIPFLAYPTALLDSSGMLLGAVNTLVDISERKQAEESRNLLAREVHHRTKNLLAVVQSIVAAGMDGTRSVKDTREIVLGRLQALAATYDNLITTSWEGVAFDDIIRTELEPFATQVEVGGPSLVLNPQAAQNFTLAVHELATNAAKYGALSLPGGKVSVRWSMEGLNGSSRFSFEWRESGGPAVSPRTRKGFGSLVLERVVAQGFDTPPLVDFAPDGLRYSLSVALDHVVAADVGDEDPGAATAHG